MVERTFDTKKVVVVVVVGKKTRNEYKGKRLEGGLSVPPFVLTAGLLRPPSSRPSFTFGFFLSK